MAVKYLEPTWPISIWNPSSSAFEADTTISGSVIPAPDTDPYAPATRANVQFLQAIDGSMVGVYAPRKSLSDLLRFQWTRQSGSALKVQIERYMESGVGLRITPHTGPPISGVFTELRPAARPGYLDNPTTQSRATLWDVNASFQPINVASGT